MMDSYEVKKELINSKWIENPFKVLAAISRISASNSELGRDLVIRALEKKNEIEDKFQEILNELVIQVGLYPYVEEINRLSLRSAISHASHRADGEMEGFVLHRSQAKVLYKLLNGESVILSAPTSFGKSLLIDILIASKDFNNIVLIVPTLALVEETRRRMSRFGDRYSIITATEQSPSSKNIYVLTQERFLAMIENIVSVDFFVIDEFYKLSIANSGNRATQLNQAFLKLIQTKAQFYLLGPSIQSIPEAVKEKLKCSFIVENFQTVSIELKTIHKKPNKDEALAKLLDEINGQTLIYCQSPNSTRKVLKKYLELRNISESTDVEINEAASWTAENYHDQWLVSIGLRYGIGIHHGRLPRALGRFMIRAFEEGKIKILLCTSTLIEGVNTAAKNVIIYDNKLNKKPLDFFTFNNIRGRSGRMFRHFVGNVYIFDTPPHEELPFVDIPVLNPSESTPNSLLLQLDLDNIPPLLRPKVEFFKSQDILPFDMLIKLSSIEPEYLIETAKFLNGLNVVELEKFSWSSKPTYENILVTSQVIWEKLGGNVDAGRSAMTSFKMMAYWVWELYKKRNVPAFRKMMIENQINHGKSPDDAVENVLAFLRGWASFNYPKYLMALNEIVNYILLKRGLRECNYGLFSALIEHLFQPSSYASLEEFGLPMEIAQRLVKKNIFSDTDSIENIIKTLKNNELSNFAENSFEKRVIEDFQEGIGKRNYFIKLS